MQYNDVAPAEEGATPLTRRQRILSRRRVVQGALRLIMTALTLYMLLYLLLPRYRIEGRSMEPNFHTDDYVLVSRLHYRLGEVERGDLVAFRLANGRALIKRVIGLPGDSIVIRGGRVIRNGVLLQEDYVAHFCPGIECPAGIWDLGPDDYFVLGDNRAHSDDSQDFGPIHRDQIVGEVIMRYFPLSQFEIFESIVP